jgi:hypothetical protein
MLSTEPNFNSFQDTALARLRQTIQLDVRTSCHLLRYNANSLVKSACIDSNVDFVRSSVVQAIGDTNGLNSGVFDRGINKCLARVRSLLKRR